MAKYSFRRAIACDLGLNRIAVLPDGCPHPLMGVRLSERTLWQMRGEIATHGNTVPNLMQYALCPSDKPRHQTARMQPPRALSRNIH